MSKTPRKPAKKPAAKKKTKAPPRDLSKAEAFYVEQHFGKKPPQQLADEIGAPRESVEAYIKQLRDAGFKPEQNPTAVQKAGFAVKEGTVSMTPASSETGDQFRGVTADGSKPARKRNDEFFNRRGGGIHVIDPSRPVQ